MTVLLAKAYGGVPAGQVVSFTSELEAALIAQGLATASTRASTTTGAQTQNALQGTAAIAAGTSSVVVTNSLVDANSHVDAKVAQAAADGTLLRVERVVCAAGSFTIFGTANATATTLIDWEIVIQSGQSQKLT
jgi:hypothetical protein